MKADDIYKSLSTPKDGKFEFNLAEFPITFLSKQNNNSIQSIKYTDTIRGKDNKPIEREWIVKKPSDGWGNPSTIEVLFVDEKYRRNGFGLKLMNSAVEWFKVKKIDEIELTVVYGNEAVSFYEKLGFYPRSIIMATKS